jgi:hypothetical protein
MAARPGGVGGAAAPEERVLIFYEGEAADAGASTTAVSVTLPHPRTGAGAAAAALTRGAACPPMPLSAPMAPMLLSLQLTAS